MSQKKARKRKAASRQGAGVTSRAASLTSAQLSAVVAIGLAFCVGVACELTPLNGFQQLTNWTWTWRDLGIGQTAVLLASPFAMIVWVVWRAEDRLEPRKAWLLVSYLAFANFLLQVLGIMADPRGLRLVQLIVTSRGATSYFTDAMAIHQLLPWLAHFPSPGLGDHSATHPPGPILVYYAFLKALGPATGALIGGCAVGLLGSLGVGVMYLFASLWTAERRVRLIASALYALLPSLMLVFPEFDQVYPIFSMLLIYAWVRALDDAPRSWRFAVATGVALAAATFFAYNVLAVGTFLLYFALYWLWRAQWSRAALAKFLGSSGIVVGVWIGLYVLIWLGTGYNAIASFRHAMANQAVIAADMSRRYAPFAMLDPYDFFLGAGIIALPLLVFQVRQLWIERDARQTELAFTLIGLAAIVTVDLSGLLRGEVARVWLFLQPLVTVPVALALARLSRPWRLTMFTLQWMILVCLKAKMTFVEP